MTAAEQQASAALRLEIMLQINQRLYEAGVIPEQLYEQAKSSILRT